MMEAFAIEWGGVGAANLFAGIQATDELTTLAFDIKDFKQPETIAVCCS